MLGGWGICDADPNLGRFGWVNASYQYGLTIVNTHMKRALGTCTPWDTFSRAVEAGGEVRDGGLGGDGEEWAEGK